MTRIDAHQHFWFYKADRDTWIDESMSVLKQNFLPEDLQPLMNEASLGGCVSVQAGQSEKETHFLLNLANEFEAVRGVVGWVDLRADDLEDRLDHFDRFPKLKGFRHILEEDPDPELITKPEFQEGLRVLGERGYTYDILIYAHQLEQTVKAIQDLPEMPLVIDHLAKPDVEAGWIDDWSEWMRKLSDHEHVHCKLSGLVTEANWADWEADAFTPYLDVAYEVFGPERLMFGSDWPVCTLAASYAEVVDLIETYVSDRPEAEQNRVFGETAAEFYDLDVS